jgi:hypothetical protein
MTDSVLVELPSNSIVEHAYGKLRWLRIRDHCPPDIKPGELKALQALGLIALCHGEYRLTNEGLRVAHMQKRRFE